MFSEEVLKRGGESTGPFPVKLDSDDSMFSVMRDLNFRAVGVFLSDKAKEISAQFEVSYWRPCCVLCVMVEFSAPHSPVMMPRL